MDETVKKLESAIGGRQKITIAASRRELANLSERIHQQEESSERRERDMRTSVGVMVSNQQQFGCVPLLFSETISSKPKTYILPQNPNFPLSITLMPKKSNPNSKKSLFEKWSWRSGTDATYT